NSEKKFQRRTHMTLHTRAPARSGGLNPVVAAVVATLLAARLASATPPDAGQALQQLQPAPAAPPATPTGDPQAPPAPERTTAPGGPTFTLTRVRLVSKIFSNETLLALVKDGYGQKMDLAGLNVLAGRITRYCRSHGYPFAVALVPAQTLSGGEATIEVVEG